MHFSSSPALSSPRVVTRCYACDATSVGTRDRRAEGGAIEMACRRHADPFKPCNDCGVPVRAGYARCARCLAVATLEMLEARVRVLRGQIARGIELHILHGCLSVESALEQVPAWWDESESLLTDEQHERVIAAVQELETMLASQGREPIDYHAVEEAMRAQGPACGGPGRELARAA